MKYRLRSLMVVVTLLAIGLGGRIEYLRRCAVYHEREVASITSTLKDEFGWSPGEPVPSSVPELLGLQYFRHQVLAWEYRAATRRPWVTIKSELPPQTEEELMHQRLQRIPAELREVAAP